MAHEESAPLVRSWSRLDGVDFLRSLAIFFVLMNHVNIRLLSAYVPYSKGLPPQLTRSLVWNGQEGVQMFFAISGFLITSTSLRRWGSLSAISIRDFYRLRFARIAPLLLLLLAVLSALHFAHLKNFAVSPKTGGLGRALLAALTFHINLLEARRDYLPANWDILWSLSVEEMFYLFFPLACRFFRRGQALTILLLLFVFLGPFAHSASFNHNPIWREYSYLGGMDAIALGCLTALLLAKHTLSRTILWVTGSLGGALLVFILCFSIRAYSWGLDRNGLYMTLLAIGTCLLIAVAAQTQWKTPRFLSPLLQLGQRSYEIYLTHMFIVFSFFFFFLHFNKPIKAVPALFAVVIIVSALLGEAAARLYSEPMNRYLRRHRCSGTNKLKKSREEPMQINDHVENFTLQNQDGKTVNLTDFKGSPVVLFFYPRADTPGCTIESCGFRDAFEKFQKAGIVVLGISRDTVKDQKKFKDKYDLPYDLLADPDMELINRYDLIKPKNMYGKLVKGVKRTTYLIGPDQRLIHIFEEVKPEGHAEEVLALLKKHK